MKIVIDMNLSQEWVQFFEVAGYEAKHWSHCGKPNAKDREILSWAKEHRSVVFTHDLDFSALLAASNAEFPSVIQLRDEDVLPSPNETDLLAVLNEYQFELVKGALLTIDKKGKRLRLLPIREPGKVASTTASGS